MNARAHDHVRARAHARLQARVQPAGRHTREESGEWRAACAGGPIYRAGASVANIGPFVRGFSHHPIIGSTLPPQLPTALISVLVADISGPAALRYDFLLAAPPQLHPLVAEP